MTGTILTAATSADIKEDGQNISHRMFYKNGNYIVRRGYGMGPGSGVNARRYIQKTMENSRAASFSHSGFLDMLRAVRTPITITVLCNVGLI